MGVSVVSSILDMYEELFPEKIEDNDKLLGNTYRFFIESAISTKSFFVEKVLFNSIHAGDNPQIIKLIVNMYKNSKINLHKAKILSKIIVSPKHDEFFELLKQELANDDTLIKIIAAIGVLHYISPYDDLLDICNLAERSHKINLLVFSNS